MTDAARLVDALRNRSFKLAVAESLTGGKLAALITDIAGSSDVFLGSITAYQNEVKVALLNVDEAILETKGAVCSEVAEQMAKGVRKSMADACGLDPASVVGVATTGVAGPGPQGSHPAGQVFIALALPDGQMVHRELNLAGERARVRESAAVSAISWLMEQFQG